MALIRALSGSSGGGAANLLDVPVGWNGAYQTNQTIAKTGNSIVFENVNQATANSSATIGTFIDLTDVNTIVVKGNLTYVNPASLSLTNPDKSRVDISNSIATISDIRTVQTNTTYLPTNTGAFTVALDVSSLSGTKALNIKITQMTGSVTEVSFT